MQAADEADPVENEPAGQSPLIKPKAAQYLPAGQGVHAADDVAPPLENVATGQSPDGNDRPTELQCLPGKHGVQSAVEALPAEKEPNGQSPLAAERP